MKTQTNLKLVLLICSLVFISSCIRTKNTKNDQQCPNQVEGKIIDMSSLDGCGWMIQLNDASKLNPINLNDFSVTLRDSNNITLSYTVNTDMMDICMAGKIVTIICIADRD